MTTTGNLGLKKPSGSDKVLVKDLNDNADVLDEAIGSLSELETDEKSSLVKAINEAATQGAAYASQAAASATAAETAKTGAQAAQSGAEKSATAAANSASAAAGSATAAGNSATAAADSATAAAESKSAAADSATSAGSSATAAATAKNEAEAARDEAQAAQSAAEAARDEAQSIAGGQYVRYNAQTLTDTQQAQARENIGLGNVDNTSDADKPVSTAQQEALELKVDRDSAATVAFSVGYDAGGLYVVVD